MSDSLEPNKDNSDGTPDSRKPKTNSVKKTVARKLRSLSTESKFELQQYLGEDMDKAVSAALKSWDEFVSKYPGQTVDKSLLVNNIALIHRLLEAVVPNVLQDHAVLEDQYHTVLESYEIQNMKHLQDLVAVSNSIKLTASSIETFGDLDKTLDKVATYGIYMDLPVECEGPDLDVDSKLKSPFWLVCAMLPNDTLSPHLISHEMYVNLMRGCKNINVVDLMSSALMDTSEEVDGLLSELGFE